MFHVVPENDLPVPLPFPDAGDGSIPYAWRHHAADFRSGNMQNNIPQKTAMGHAKDLLPAYFFAVSFKKSTARW